MDGILAKLSPATRSVVEEQHGVAVARKTVDPSISMAGHGCLIALYIVSVLAYAIFTLVTFFTAPDQQTFLQMPASSFAAVPLSVGVSCTNYPNCGDITLQANYSNSLACGIYASAARNVGNMSAVSNYQLTACYVQPDLFTVQTTARLLVQGAQVDFSAIDPGTVFPTQLASGIVTVTSPTVDTAFLRQVTLDTWQVKTLLIGQNIIRKDGNVVSRTLYPMGVQYEGKRPNRRATLFLSLSPLVNVYDSSASSTIFETIASIGGAASIVAAVLVILTPVARVVFRGQAAKDEAGEKESQPDHTSTITKP